MNRKRVVTGVLLAATALFSLGAKGTTTSLDERVAIKKLSQYWEEKDLKRAKTTLLEIIQNYPQSSYIDAMRAMLGDLYFSEKEYENALLAYDQIQSKEHVRKSAFRRLHSLYELQRFSALIEGADAFLNDPHAPASEINILSFEVAESCKSEGQRLGGEEQTRLFKKAILYYEGLQRTDFQSSVFSPLAFLYSALSEYPKAALTYLTWAQHDESRQEELLFAAASLQMHYSKKSAIQTLDRVFKMKGPLAPKAGYNMIVLLFQMERYSDVVQASIYVDQLLPEEKKGAAYYYIGKSLFHEQDFESAAALLEESLREPGSEELREGILVTLLSCSEHLNDLSLCDRVIQQMKGTVHLPEALLLHSELCRQRKEWQMARSDMEKLLVEYPQHPARESLLYDVALLLMQEEKGEAGADGFEAFVKEYPDSAYRKDALSNSLYLRYDRAQTTLNAEKTRAEMQLRSTLELALEKPSLFPQSQVQHMRLLLAQTHFHQGAIDTSIALLEDYVRDFPKDKSCKEAYLLLTACYQGRDEERHAHYAEKTLLLDPHVTHHAEMHRLLFNSYLKRCSAAAPKEKATLLDKAADHLFYVSDGSASQENLRWLAGYYLKQNSHSERALVVLERLLLLGGGTPLLTPHVESETLRLSLLYRESRQLDKSRDLLEALTAQQQKDSDLDWKYGRMALFELGKTYSLLGQKEKAATLYQTLVDASSHISSYFASAAELELAKLRFSKVRPEDVDAATETCDRLKEIALQRQLCSEPLHIEADLEYVSIKVQLSDPTQQTAKQCLLLEQVKKELTTFHDPQALAFPEKEELIKQYLSYIESALSRLRGGSTQKWREELELLLSNAHHETLRERIVKNLEELDCHL